LEEGSRETGLENKRSFTGRGKALGKVPSGRGDVGQPKRGKKGKGDAASLQDWNQVNAILLDALCEGGGTIS